MAMLLHTADTAHRLVHAPTDPHGPLAAVKGFLQRRAVFDHPPVDGRVLHVDPTFKHELFDVARAQGVGDIPADAHEHDILWKMRPLEAYRHRSSAKVAL